MPSLWLAHTVSTGFRLEQTHSASHWTAYVEFWTLLPILWKHAKKSKNQICSTTNCIPTAVKSENEHCTYSVIYRCFQISPSFMCSFVTTNSMAPAQVLCWDEVQQHFLEPQWEGGQDICAPFETAYLRINLFLLIINLDYSRHLKGAIALQDSEAAGGKKKFTAQAG